MAREVILTEALNLCLQPGEFEISRRANMYFYFNEGHLMKPVTK